MQLPANMPLEVMCQLEEMKPGKRKKGKGLTFVPDAVQSPGCRTWTCYSLTGVDGVPIPQHLARGKWFLVSGEGSCMLGEVEGRLGGGRE